MIKISEIIVVDAPCGAGKTTWATQYINNTDEKIIYCTPFLDEVNKIRKNCGYYKRFSEPNNYNGISKINSFNQLLAEGKDIAVTHTTFLNATNETINLIREGGYTIFIDESLDVVVDFNRVQMVECDNRQTINDSDISYLKDREIIQIAEDNLVIWQGGEIEDEAKISAVKRFAEQRRLYCIFGELFLTIFPPEVFRCVEKNYVLTYRFDSSMFKWYFDMFGLDFVRKSINKNGDEYSLTEFDLASDIAFRRNCKELIHICDDSKLNNYDGYYDLSKSWFERNKKNGKLKTLQLHLAGFYRSIEGAKAGDIMWTTYKDYYDCLSVKGYKQAHNITRKDKEGLSPAELEHLIKKSSCFLSCNAKATNDYKDRWVLAYCVNMFMNSTHKHFFLDGNSKREREGLPNIVVDEDEFALSCLIQWMFRSRIRDGLPIEMFIPSQRMRDLLINWMDASSISPSEEDSLSLLAS